VSYRLPRDRWSARRASDICGVHRYLGDSGRGAHCICLEFEGALWVADSINERVIRVFEGGRVASFIR
jgi:hypothetical protein